MPSITTLLGLMLAVASPGLADTASPAPPAALGNGLPLLVVEWISFKHDRARIATERVIRKRINLHEWKGWHMNLSFETFVWRPDCNRNRNERQIQTRA